MNSEFVPVTAVRHKTRLACGALRFQGAIIASEVCWATCKPVPQAPYFLRPAPRHITRSGRRARKEEEGLRSISIALWAFVALVGNGPDPGDLSSSEPGLGHGMDPDG